MIYENIKILYKEKKISVSKLEVDLNFPRSSICKWNDNEPGVKRVKSVADHFGVSIGSLLETDVKEAAQRGGEGS